MSEQFLVPEYDQAATLPPAMPTIIMDRAWGEQTHFIDFDYHGFYRLAKEEGIADHDINALTVQFIDDQREYPAWHVIKNTLNAHEAGRYEPDEKRIIIKTTAKNGCCFIPSEEVDSPYHVNSKTKLSKTKNIDIAVRHEIGHWIDDIVRDGLRLTRSEQLTQRFITHSRRAALASTFLLPIVTREGWTALPPIPAWVVCMSALAARHNKRYSENSDPRTHRLEKPAYEYEARTRHISLIAFSPKIDYSSYLKITPIN